MIQLNIAMEALTSESLVLVSKIANTAGYLNESHLIHAVQRVFRLSAKAVAEKEHPALLTMHSSSRQV